MATRKKVTRAKAPAAVKSAKRKAKPAKTRALSVKDAVMREELPAWSAMAAAQHAQNGLLHAMLTWSPVSLIVSQQAAFWEGYTRSAKVDRPSTQKRPRSR
ncbi:MAG: hypothetical protein ABI457_06780 [Hyphomicrobium sp.]|jgi:hypothetical protein